MKLYTLCYEIKMEGRRTENVWLTHYGLPLKTARTQWQSALLTGTFAGFSMGIKPMPANLDGEQVSKNRATWLQVIETSRKTGAACGPATVVVTRAEVTK